MATTHLKPNTNWHRLLHLLDLNQGTLYRAQLYVIKNYYDHVHGRIVMSPDHLIKTDGMPKMTRTSAFKPASYAYEHRAERFGLVAISHFNNRKYVTLLPKGRDVLDNFFRKNKKWEVQ